MLKGGVIMDVMNPEQARIAEKAGAVAGLSAAALDHCLNLRSEQQVVGSYLGCNQGCFFSHGP